MKKKNKKPIDLVVIGTRVGCLGIVLFTIVWTVLLVKLFISLI